LLSLLVACGSNGSPTATAPTDPDAGDVSLDSGLRADGTDPNVICFGLPSLKADDMVAFSKTLNHDSNFKPMTDAQVDIVENATRALMEGDLDGARAQGRIVGYTLVPLKTTECLWLLRPGETTPPGQGHFIYRPKYTRDLILETPHIPFDTDSDIESSIIFDKTGAKVLMFAGAIRCGDLKSSNCGRNTACNKSGDPARSDPAHSPVTAFHGFHRAVATPPDPAIVLQIHGNSDKTNNGDALVTNGTKLPFTGTHAAAFFAAFKAETKADVRNCNDPANPPTDIAECGESNVQGHITNAVDLCTNTPTAARDNFVHIEQNLSHLIREQDTWSQSFVNAVLKVFPETGIVPVTYKDAGTPVTDAGGDGG
jgi:hypothetical protein